MCARGSLHVGWNRIKKIGKERGWLRGQELGLGRSLSGFWSGTLGVPLGGTRRVGGLLGANQNNNEVPFHASQNGCDPNVYKQ